MQKGNIRVQTENIFPIIKKFLYSDHEIFIRELVSNAIDATQKLKTLSSIGEAKGDMGELRIDIKLDAEKKTLTISDRGVGMTAEEIDKYLRVVTLEDGMTIHNAFPDRNFRGEIFARPADPRTAGSQTGAETKNRRGRAHAAAAHRDDPADSTDVRGHAHAGTHAGGEGRRIG